MKQRVNERRSNSHAREKRQTIAYNVEIFFVIDFGLYT